MQIRRASLLMAAVCAIATLTSCNKKQTRVEPSVEPAPAVEAPVAVPEEHVQTDNDIFVPIDMDQKMKSILVPVYFDYDKWDLLPESIIQLEKIASFLAENTSVRLLIEGHADERGTNEYNIGLGENRAKTAKEYLASYGVKPSRLEYTSYGRERPATPNCQDDVCHGKNRRVEWSALAK
jgi:peptidoglycan-associated lipoprotein